MRIVWRPTANNFWCAKLETSAIVPAWQFDGTYHDAPLQDIGYVAKELNGFVVRYYGSVSRTKHPIERIVFATKEEAMESAERHALALLASKILSR